MTSDSDNKGKVDSENWRQPTPAAASGEQRTGFQESNLGKCAGNRIRLAGEKKLLCVAQHGGEAELGLSRSPVALT